MANNQNQPSNVESSSVSNAIKRAIRDRSPFTVLIVVVVFITLPLLAISSNIITVSQYSSIIIELIFIVSLLVAIAIYLVRILDESGTNLRDENKRLKSQLAQIEAHLTTTQIHNGDLRTLHDVLTTNVLHKAKAYFQEYLQQIISEVELAKSFKDGFSALADDLISNHAQLQGEELTITLPIGKQQGANYSLVYFLSRPSENPHLQSTRLGQARIIQLDDAQSIAVIDEAAIQSPFWNRVRQNCREQGMADNVQIKASPAVRQLFRDTTSGTLSVIEQLLKEIIQIIERLPVN